MQYKKIIYYNPKILEFINIKDYSPNRIINPDSVVFENPIVTYHNYFNVLVKFKLLDGREYKGSANGENNKNNRAFLFINGEKQNLDRQDKRQLFSVDAQLFFSTGEKINYYFYEFDNNYAEFVSGNNKNIVLEKDKNEDNQISIESILKSDKTFIEAINKIGIKAQISTPIPIMNEIQLINWKFRYRENNENISMRNFYTPSYFHEESFVSSNMTNVDKIYLNIENNFQYTSLWKDKFI